MQLARLERFSLDTIADALRRFGELGPARSALSFAVGSALIVSGKVSKVVKREGQCKLVIEPGDRPGFVTFADCLPDAAAVASRRVRKGSAVMVRGKFQSFGYSAVCLVECRLLE